MASKSWMFTRKIVANMITLWMGSQTKLQKFLLENHVFKKKILNHKWRIFKKRKHCLALWLPIAVGFQNVKQRLLFFTFKKSELNFSPHSMWLKIDIFLFFKCFSIFLTLSCFVASKLFQLFFQISFSLFFFYSKQRRSTQKYRCAFYFHQENLHKFCFTSLDYHVSRGILQNFSFVVFSFESSFCRQYSAR